jgi:hypothetical protein
MVHPLQAQAPSLACALSLPRQGTMATHATKHRLLQAQAPPLDDGAAPQGTTTVWPDDGTTPQGSGDAASSKAWGTPRRGLPQDVGFSTAQPDGGAARRWLCLFKAPRPRGR